MTYTANYAAVRTRYVDDTVATASPAKLLTMLYDRLLLDLQRAENEQRAADRAAAGVHLTHAQDIVSELAATLDVSAWDGAQQLLSIYTFLLTELVAANVSGDADRTASCRALVEPLADAWHQAAAQLGATLEPARPASSAAFSGAGAGSFGELGVG
ncbi:flagellar export chaperone FliS [Actinotalea ferrariae]|uniref:flagellar export chaperone FliS n=1 Tax=Actinotalea ferrariae TaxID=1386098 RepID=UPI001C8CC0F6|nr:flagellar export chaperone FliS [Actinotalea ferrariae]MBX9246633.1 flagellar export chaperone FliS [Actinotalea ferrariae]